MSGDRCFARIIVRGVSRQGVSGQVGSAVILSGDGSRSRTTRGGGGKGSAVEGRKGGVTIFRPSHPVSPRCSFGGLLSGRSRRVDHRIGSRGCSRFISGVHVSLPVSLRIN